MTEAEAAASISLQCDADCSSGVHPLPDWPVFVNVIGGFDSNNEWSNSLSQRLDSNDSRWSDASVRSRNSSVPATSVAASGFGSEVMIPLYSIIFFLSIVGNALVIVTLAQNRRMRTVTNVFLLNLAVADLLLGVFCMPFTLIGQLLRDFIFGGFMCKIIPYFQAVSVSVGVWTLVAISLERYFAICRPLRSRIWQTRSHAYKMIAAVWIVSLAGCLPIAVLSRLMPIRDTGRHKCREEWPDLNSERAYNLLLDATLLLLPLVVMAMAYWLIAARLWRGLRRERTATRYPPLQTSTRSMTTSQYNASNPGSIEIVESASGSTNNGSRTVVVQWPPSTNHRRLCCEPPRPIHQFQQRRGMYSRSNGTSSRPTNTIQIMDCQTAFRNGVRSTYTDKSVSAKKKVIRMLFVIVLEFFVCWTPLYIVNTWHGFDPEGLYTQMGSTEISLIQLLAYLSSCCNPITYCFMNEKFRNGFLNAFGCCGRYNRHGAARSTDLVSGSLNDSFYLGRRSFRGKPRVKPNIMETSFAVLDATTSNVRSPD